MFKGAEYLFKGFKLITKPGIKRYVVIPMLINILVFSGFISCAYHYTGIANGWLEAHLPQWLQWIHWLLWGLFVIGILFFFVYIFTIIANIIAAPFNGFLSEKIETLLVGKKTEEELSMIELCLLLPKTIVRQFQLAFYFLPRAIIMLILFFIPGVNVVAGISWFLFSSWMMTIQYLDYPFDNHNVSFKEMIKSMKKNYMLHTSFGMMTTLLSLVPIVNLFVIPAAVAGITALWVDNHSKNFIHQDQHHHVNKTNKHD